MNTDKPKPAMDSDQPTPPSPPTGSWRNRFRRSHTDSVFGGLCAGLGASTSIPCLVWRLAFVLLGLCYGLGVLIYLVGFFVFPSSRPPEPASAPFFRKTDWRTFWGVTLFVFIGYWWTLAPNLTLEDSGELAVGSFYAGVPHPPGYPVWTLYTWLFTLIPFSNIAWRVALSSAVAGAFASGILALMVSRGSSLILEGINELKQIDRRLEDALCVIAGFISGTLLAFNGFMWSQSVIVEVYTLSVLSFMGVLCHLFRWMYSPKQLRHLYWAFFWFGICFTNHQTLIVAAMGIEVAVLVVNPKLGRDMFLGNSLVYLIGLVLKAKGILTAFDTNVPLFLIYNTVGIGSIITSVMVTLKVGKPLSDWKPILHMALLWVLGSSFYFYMPLASMTNPPLNWGYPRTEEGFIHALTRGQYEQTNPTDSVGKFMDQVGMYAEGAIDEMGLVNLLVGLLPFLFFQRLQKRERNWMVGLTAIYLCLAFLLLILLNPNTDMQSRNQARVFFTASHIMLAMSIGYGFTILGGLLATQYQEHRSMALWGGSVAAGIELFYVLRVFEASQFLILRSAAIFGLLAAVAFTLLILFGRRRAATAALLAVFAIVPARSILSNWSDAEQRGHLFGYWFGHDMFSPPLELYPEMARDAVLFGGTDPGRFNPTYMIFCESFIPPRCKPEDPEFDRRDVYLITQNALADKTYLEYIRAHYNRSTQKDPYFFSELFRSDRPEARGRTNLLAKAMLPLDHYFTGLGERIEKSRRAHGVYPPKEIHTPTPEESEEAFTAYINDAARRLQHDAQFPNEPRQVKPGEGVQFTKDGRVQVSGQVAVMAINAILAKAIFDNNPDHEFYVEESFPLDWMYPHLTPFGIIMKINREPVPTITEEMMQKDHQFWSQYSEKFIGNWITYDTPVKEICDFAVRTYLHRDFQGFTGDRAFVRDSVAQKSFSKLRSAIGWIYGWRLSPECPPEYQLKPGSPEEQRMFKEADFALRQSYALCPYSPEALHKYVTLLLSANRYEDALLVAETSLLFDPINPVFLTYAEQLRRMSGTQGQLKETNGKLAQLDAQYRANPTNFDLGLQLAEAYIQIQRPASAIPLLREISSNPAADIATVLSVAQSFASLGMRAEVDATVEKLGKLLKPMAERYQADTNDVIAAFQLVSAYLVTQDTEGATALVDELVNRPTADASTLLSAAQVYHQLQAPVKLESTLQRLVTQIPTNPEAWYDLAGVQVALAKTNDAIASLQRALQLSDGRRAVQAGAKDLTSEAAADPRFETVRQMPEFQRLITR